MKIIMYTKKGCPWCDGVRDLLNDKKVVFEEREVRFNPQHFKELIDISKQELTPTLIIDGKDILADSDKEQVAEYLKEKDVRGF